MGACVRASAYAAQILDGHATRRRRAADAADLPAAEAEAEAGTAARERVSGCGGR